MVLLSVQKKVKTFILRRCLLIPLILFYFGLTSLDRPSNSWAIKKPVFKANVYSLDDSLCAEYAKFLESGSLPTFETETMQEQTASSSTEIFATIVRNVSKLNKLSFSNTTSTGYVGGFGEILKEYNSLYHPLAHQGSAVDSGYYGPMCDLTASLVIGHQVIIP